MPEQLFAQPEDILKAPEVNYLTIGKVRYASYTPPPQPDNNYLEAAAGIAAAFLAFRYLMSVGLNAENVRRREEVDAAIQKIQSIALPQFTVYAEPAIQSAASIVNNKIEENYASVYSDLLGKYISETSAASMLEGYTAAINAGIERIKSWEIAANGYGLDHAQMRQYITAAIKDENAAKPGYNTRERTKPSEALLQKLIDSRAGKIGENEAFAAAQMSTVVSYQASQYRGEISNGVRKWETAKDEKVCKICGPLDGMQVDMFEPFSVNGKAVWAPGVHPNCRCSVSIMYPANMVSKAYGDDPYNRDPEGQFSRTESRGRRTVALDPERAAEVSEKLKEAVVDPFAQAIAERDKKAAADPFARALSERKAKQADPFAQQQNDPFARAIAERASQTDPFAEALKRAESDPFAVTKDPFAEAKDPFKVESVPATILINGISIKIKRKTKPSPSQTDPDYEEPEEPDDEGDQPSFHGDPLYMFGTHIEENFKRRGDKHGFRIGSVIDFDQILPIDQDELSGNYYHIGYAYGGVDYLNPKALAFMMGGAQDFLLKPKNIQESPELSYLNSEAASEFWDFLDNNSDVYDIEDLLDTYGSTTTHLDHIYENYLKELPRDIQLDRQSLNSFSNLSLYDKREALIDISNSSPEDDQALRTAIGHYEVGSVPPEVMGAQAMYEEGSSASKKNLDIVFKFVGFNGWELKEVGGLPIPGGIITGRYEIVDIEYESDIDEKDMQDAALFTGNRADIAPKTWKLVTVRPERDYGYFGI